MKNRFFAWLLILSLLPIFPVAHADACAACSGAGYTRATAFGTGETVFVNCAVCGGTGTKPESSEVQTAGGDTFKPDESFVQLPDPGKYAFSSDQCVYAESDYAVFECETGYDIDGYISALAKSAGLKIENSYDLDEGNIRYYQLSVSSSDNQNTFSASVYYHAAGRISLSSDNPESVSLPDRALAVQLFSWMPKEKSIHLPDISGYARESVTVRKWTPNSITYDCGEDFNLAGYIDVLRYEYGFDLEAIMQDHNENTTYYAMFNPDLDEKTLRIGDSAEIEKTNRHLELAFSAFGFLTIKKAGGSAIQLPVPSDAYYKEESEQKQLPGLYPVYFSDVTHVINQSVYEDVSAGGFERVIAKLITRHCYYDIVEIRETDNEKTFYLFTPGYHVDRISGKTAHLEVRYHADTQTLYLTKSASEIKLANDKKPDPVPIPQPDDPDVTHDPYDPCPTPFPNDESSCSICGGSGNRNCSTCNGFGKYDCGGCDNGSRRCGSCNGTGTRSGGKSCSSCGGRGRQTCSSCSGTGKLTCSSCSGSGKTRCSTCGGDGKR